jgi:hypothetical protein
MRVEFRKTGARRYAVIIHRENLPHLEMNPAPGFDPLVPHDLLHFLVEQELALENAIFGQIAGGGTAGTFQQSPTEAKSTRTEARQRRKINKRGTKMLKSGIDECAQSERATLYCLQNWYENSTDVELRARAAIMKETARSVFGTMTQSEKKKLNKDKLADIRRRMDDLSRRWSALTVDQSLTLDW